MSSSSGHTDPEDKRPPTQYWRLRTILEIVKLAIWTMYIVARDFIFRS
ncbi:hypothetical protein [Actinomadura sp. KC06]|nr:hypothetical protein [Actinomadura sp. KC06]